MAAQTGKYIVVFKKDGHHDHAINNAKALITAGGGVIGQNLDIINGIAVTLPDDLLSSLVNNPCINYIEPDGVVTIAAKNLGIGK